MKVHEAMGRAVADERPGAVFSLLGNANMEFLASLVSDGGPPHYKGRIEGAVVTMAEGYARTSGEVGVAVVSAGPAMANATNALCCASRNRAPMVVITGQPGERSHQQYFHHESLADLVGAKYYDVKTPSSVLDVVKEAFYDARTERRPVILDVPRPTSVSDFKFDYEYRASFEDLVPPRRLPAEESTLAEVIELIASSERPVLLAGRGAVQSGAREAIVDLGDEIGALLATSLFAKNWFAGEPFDIGVSGLFSVRYTAEILADADLIIGIGASLNHYTIEGGYLFPMAKMVQIDTATQLVTGTGNRADYYVNGDARLAVEALARGVRQRGIGGTRARTDAMRQQIVEGKADPDPAEFELEPGRGDARRLINAVDEVFPGDCPMVIANGHQWGITIPEFKKWRFPQLYSTAFGSIGMALPTALGAAVASPGKPVLHIEGDGSLMMNIHTLDTMAQYELPVFSVVMNDSSFGSEEHQMRAHGFDPELSFQHEVDYAGVAASFGCRSATVRTPDEMRKAAEEFLSNPGPYVVDARISRSVISVPFRRLHYGIDA